MRGKATSLLVGTLIPDPKSLIYVKDLELPFLAIFPIMNQYFHLR